MLKLLESRILHFFFYCNNIIETNKTKTSKDSVSTKPTQNSIVQIVVSIYRFS